MGPTKKGRSPEGLRPENVLRATGRALVAPARAPFALVGTAVAVPAARISIPSEGAPASGIANGIGRAVDVAERALATVGFAEEIAAAEAAG